MSVDHFHSLQQLIAVLEAHGYREITDQVKPLYDNFFHLCMLVAPPPAPGEEEESVICDTVEELVTLVERVDPSRLRQQVWFCEQCQAVSAIRYRKGAGHTEVIAALSGDHRSTSPRCTNTAYWLRVINPAVIVSQEALLADNGIPDWAKARLTELLFERKEAKP